MPAKAESMIVYFLDLDFFLALGFIFFLDLALVPQQQPIITSLHPIINNTLLTNQVKS